jgi:ParB family chromosome partitioning protein
MTDTLITQGADVAADYLSMDMAPYAAEPGVTPRRAAVPMTVSLSQVHASPSNPRKTITLEEIEALGVSMQQHGQLTRVLLRPMATPEGSDPTIQHYELAAGHRRTLAASHIGWADIDADVREMDDHTFLMVLWAENLQRADVAPLDEAIGIRDLQAAGWDLAAIAFEIGRPEAYVRGRLALLQLSSAAQQAMHLGLLPVMHAQELAKLPASVQDEVLRELFNLSPVKLVDPDAKAEDQEDLTPEEELDEEFGGEPAHRHLTEEDWKPVKIPSLEDLRGDLKSRYYRRLSVVPWALGDATLVKGAGACTACEKRSGHAPSLFPELANARGEACLDAACFKTKEQAWERREEQQRIAATLPEGAPMPTKKELKAQDAEARAADKARREQESARAQEQRLQRYRMKAAARVAGVRAVLGVVTPAGLHSVPLLRALLHALISDREFFADPRDVVLLQVLELELPSPLPTTYHWQHEPVRAWIDEPTRTDRSLVRALVLFVLGIVGDVRVNEYYTESPYNQLLRVADALGVKVVDTMATVEQETKAQLVAEAKAEKQATRAAAKAAAKPAADTAEDAPAPKKRGRPRKVAA